VSILPANPTRLRAEEAHLMRTRLERIDAGIDRLVEVVAKAAAFTPADVEEVGRMLVEGRIRLPVHARLTVITTVEDVRDRRFNTSTQVITHEADQLHTKLLRPLTVLQALEAGLIRHIPSSGRSASGWTWREDVYERLAASEAH
jgi:hypothetical protein